MYNYICVHLLVFVCVCVCVRACVCVCVWVRAYVCGYVLCMHVHVHTYACMYAYVYIYVYACINVCGVLYVAMHMCVCVFVCVWMVVHCSYMEDVWELWIHSMYPNIQFTTGDFNCGCSCTFNHASRRFDSFKMEQNFDERNFHFQPFVIMWLDLWKPIQIAQELKSISLVPRALFPFLCLWWRKKGLVDLRRNFPPPQIKTEEAIWERDYHPLAILLPNAKAAL